MGLAVQVRTSQIAFSNFSATSAASNVLLSNSGVKTSPSIRKIISVLKGADGKLKEDTMRKSCSTSCLAKAEDASSSKKRKSSADDIMEISSAEFLSDCEAPTKPTQQRLKESRSSFGIKSPAKTSTWWIDWAECLVKRRQGHDIQVAVLEPGPDGFVLAQFEAEKFVTEMPNLYLKQHTGKQRTAGKSSAKVSKKPAAGVAILRKAAAANSAADVSAAPAAAAACELVKIDEEACEASPEEKPLGSILKVCKTCASKQSYVQAVLQNKKKKLFSLVRRKAWLRTMLKLLPLCLLLRSESLQARILMLKKELLAERAKLVL